MLFKTEKWLDWLFNIPPLPEQKKIVAILATWDEAINTTEQLLANSHQRKKALMQQLLTGKVRFNGFEEQWEEKELSVISNLDSGFSFKSSDFVDEPISSVPIIRMSDFKDGELSLENAARVSLKAVEDLDKFKLSAGDFIFGMSGSLSNYGTVKNEDLPCYLNQRVGRIKAKQGNDQKFITFLYLSDLVQQRILDKAAGAAQLNISITDLRELMLTVPNHHEQQKISTVLTTADDEIGSIRAQLNHLRFEKKALMQQLLTGKVRVKIEETA